MAKEWQDYANDLITAEEKANQIRLNKLILHPLDKAFLTKMIDQCFRSNDMVRVADQIIFLLKRSAFPEFFNLWDIFLMWFFITLGHYFPRFSVPIIINTMRRDSENTILPGEKEILKAILRKKRQEGIRLNLVNLGQPIMGEEEATGRLHRITSYLKDPEVECVSLKISSILPQIQTLAFEYSLNQLIIRLSQIYRTAQSHYYTYKNGIQVPKFVNLDVEDYAEFELTKEAFKRTLDQIEFKNHTAGISLQSYLPNSLFVQKELTAWARKRVASGGNPVKLRIVKGANLEMEKVHASIHSWPLATFDTKQEVDANFKRMIDFGFQNNNYKAVQLGIASHNIFELAYAYQAAKSVNSLEYLTFEMLIGVAGHIQKVLRTIPLEMVLYAPVASKNEFINAISYLIRRLNENTSEDYFLRYASGLTSNSRDWYLLEKKFIDSYWHKEEETVVTHRNQDRNRESHLEKVGSYHLGKFNNEPKTDWSIASNRNWANQIRRKWKKSPGNIPVEIPLLIGSQEIRTGRKTRTCFDHSQSTGQIPIADFTLGDDRDVEAAIEAAKKDPECWRNKTHNEKHLVLSKAAIELRKSRADLIGATAATIGKSIVEVDREISDAIDFVEYYPHSLKAYIEIRNLNLKPKGLGVVISPWNYPIAASCGGIAAALATGNTVILKPSSKSVLSAWLVCQCFWNAGVSKNTLQFLPGPGEQIGKLLCTHPAVDFVILNCRTVTGMKLLATKADLNLFAETGAKNATIVTAVSDRYQAIDNIVCSAFSCGGQKSSATSLLILEKEVYEDPVFKRSLVDAARSFKTGSVWDFENRSGPLIAPPRNDLKRALTTLEEGESWALKPKNLADNPYLWSPGIKWDVQPGSFTHLTEFFGPILGVMKAQTIEHAIELSNQTLYGLTAGLECLDKRKQEYWKSKVNAGNLYINKSTIGAVTLRQPFGGTGKSALGPQIKVGGPNYVTQFLNFEEVGSPAEVATNYDRKLLRLTKSWMKKADHEEFKEFQKDIQKTVRALNSYLYHANHEFRIEKDFFHLRGQDNIFRYFPIGSLVIRVHPEDTLFDILARIVAAQIAHCKVMVSIPHDLETQKTRFMEHKKRKELISKVRIVRQSDEELIKMLPEIDRLRYADPSRVPVSVIIAAALLGQYIAKSKVMMEGRIELLHYYRSQSICHNYHRYGNLGTRAFDQSMS